MPTVERTITVARPVQLVWDYLTDFTRTEEWDPPTVSTARTSGDGGVGTTYHNVSKMVGREVEVDYEVTRFEPHRVFELVGEANGVTVTDTITFESGQETTTVTYHSEFAPHGAAKLANPLIAGAIEVLGSRVSSSLEERLLAL
ncbi:polyketide cyclase/dehydrase/lipid transport protein [Nocardioides sp. J9]|uniref:SRPBCC family protein n=1 Tax=Nocardioides sp. J9 TaxID=935844 RepID=UPI00119CBE1E|nr:SRPBCC family protein [Nocardioides sp. J9]TWG99272.1 polyketide cyclase/dehydrase/lipid transport protein [Nocardioides sp. J9]